jgi:uncharacterized GH25 family protein
MQLNIRNGYFAVFSTLLYCCVLVTDADSHDIWITTKQDEAGTIYAIVHHGHPGDRKTPDPDKLFEFNMLADGQSTRSLLPGIKSASQGGIPVLITEPMAKESNIVLLAARYDNGYWVKTQNGYRNTNKRQVPDSEESLYSMKFAKALIRTNEAAADGYDTLIGHRLELVPLSNPFGVKPGDVLKVRVHFDGKPLSGVGVEAGDGVTPMDEKDIPRYQTNEEGVAFVQIVKAGPQLLVVDYILPSTHPDLANSELYNATLSFVLPALIEAK